MALNWQVYISLQLMIFVRVQVIANVKQNIDTKVIVYYAGFVR